jgi:GTP-binding protein LepA
LTPLEHIVPAALPLAQVDTLYAGEVGYLAAQIKSVQDARVGDTVTSKKNPAPEPLEGYQDVQPMVYCGLFPTDADDYQVRSAGTDIVTVLAGQK